VGTFASAGSIRVRLSTSESVVVRCCWGGIGSEVKDWDCCSSDRMVVDRRGLRSIPSSNGDQESCSSGLEEEEEEDADGFRCLRLSSSNGEREEDEEEEEDESSFSEEDARSPSSADDAQRVFVVRLTSSSGMNTVVVEEYRCPGAGLVTRILRLPPDSENELTQTQEIESSSAA